MSGWWVNFGIWEELRGVESWRLVLPKSLAEIRKSLIRLYQTYAAEWDAVEPQISEDLFNQVINQPVSQDFQMVIQHR